MQSGPNGSGIQLSAYCLTYTLYSVCASLPKIQYTMDKTLPTCPTGFLKWHVNGSHEV